MIEYVICAPAYTERSGGVRALYKLADELDKRGERVAILNAAPVTGARAPQVFVCPDIAPAVCVERVVRWWLGPRRFHFGGLEFAWPCRGQADIQRLALDIIEPEFFYPKTAPGSGALLWIGKGAPVPVNIPDLAGDVRQITNDWPANRQELGDVLRSVDLLISFDHNSSLTTEATICGTPTLYPGAIRPSAETVFGSVGVAYGEAELPKACAEVAAAAERYRNVFCKEIAHDVDLFIESTKKRFGG